MKKKFFSIICNVIPIGIMIALIPIISNDYILTGIYLLITVISLLIYRKPFEITIFIFGFFAMIISEYFFIKTGVEIFNRHTLLGLMPLWLPFLWAYAFIVIKRAVITLQN